MLDQSSLVATVPRALPAQIGAFTVRLDIDPSGRVYNAIDAEEKNLRGDRSFLIQSSLDPALAEALFDTIDTPDVPTDEEEARWTEQQEIDFGRKYDRMIEGFDVAAERLTYAAIQAIPTLQVNGMSSPGYAIHQDRVDRRAKIACAVVLRAGEEFVGVARRILRKQFNMPPKMIHVWSNRKPKKLDIKPFDHSLEGRHLFIFDPINATGGSAADTESEIIRLSKGGHSPKATIYGFGHGHRRGFKRILDEHPNALIFNGVLHKDMDTADYLTDPGIGDGGAKISQVRDRY